MRSAGEVSGRGDDGETPAEGPDEAVGPSGRSSAPGLQQLELIVEIMPPPGTAATVRSVSEQRPPLTAAAILDAARSTMLEDGPDAVSLRRIAGRLGVTAPALYAHFASKDDLMGAIADDEFGRLLDGLVAASEGIEDPIERIRAQSRAYVDHALANPALFGVMTMFRPAWSPQPAAPEHDLASKSFEVSTVAIDDAIAAGLLRIDDPLMVGLTLWAAVHGVATVLLARPNLGDDYESELVDSVIDSVVDGLRAPR